LLLLQFLLKLLLFLLLLFFELGLLLGGCLRFLLVSSSGVGLLKVGSRRRWVDGRLTSILGFFLGSLFLFGFCFLELLFTGLRG